MIKKLILGFILLTTALGSLAEPSVMEIIALQNRTSESVQILITPLLEPQDRVIASGNSLIIRTSPDRLRAIQQLIDKLDTPIQNLIITVVQDRYLTADALNAGANVRLSVPIDQPSKTRGSIRGHLYQTRDHGSLNNTQTLRTMDGTTAHIKVGRAHPIRQTSIYHPRYGYPEVYSSTEFIEATTGFAVTPRLTGSNQVVLEVSPWSDRMNRYGMIETQGAQTRVRVNLGEWVEIGGVNEDSHYDSSGLLSKSYRSQSDNLHILIKVDKAP